MIKLNETVDFFQIEKRKPSNSSIYSRMCMNLYKNWKDAIDNDCR